MSKIILNCLIIAALFCGNVEAAKMKNKQLQQQKHFKKKIALSVDLNYLLYLPKDYKPTGQPFPLIVFLHGLGQCGDSLEQVKENGIPKFLDNDPNFPFVVVSPQQPVGARWTDILESLDFFIENIKNKYNIDKSRVYLTGLSMGGFGTWALAAVHPEKFAAIAPVCGGGELRLAVGGRYNKLPIWAFHGTKDDVVPIARSQEMVDEIKKQGGEVKFTIYPELDHNCWDAAYSDPNLYKWFLEHKIQNNGK